MAYFLKKQKQNTKTYLHVYESYYSATTKNTKHHFIKSFGSIESLKESGIEDPVDYCQREIDKLNKERQNNKIQYIGETSNIKHLGYFPIASIMNKLNIKKYIDFFKLNTNFDFDLY